MTTETMTETGSQSSMARAAYAFRHLERLAQEPAGGAPQILRWLLDGPLTLDEIIRRKGSELAYDLPADVRAEWALKGAMCQLGRCLMFYTHRDGQFHLAEEYREAVELYAKIAARVESTARSKHYDALAYYGDKLIESGGRYIPWMAEDEQPEGMAP